MPGNAGFLYAGQRPKCSVQISVFLMIYSGVYGRWMEWIRGRYAWIS